MLGGDVNRNPHRRKVYISAGRDNESPSRIPGIDLESGRRKSFRVLRKSKRAGRAEWRKSVHRRKHSEKERARFLVATSLAPIKKANRGQKIDVRRARGTGPGKGFSSRRFNGYAQQRRVRRNPRYGRRRSNQVGTREDIRDLSRNARNGNVLGLDCRKARTERGRSLGNRSHFSRVPVPDAENGKGRVRRSLRRSPSYRRFTSMPFCGPA